MTFTPRLIAILAAIAFLAVAALTVPSCIAKHRAQAAQARVEHSQAEAASQSASDAINAVAAAGARETASEDMTRTNGAEIRNAPGASVRTDAGVNLAGRRALCRRAAYKDDPKCAMFK